MGKKDEEKKIKQLLVEAITLLCKDGLQYEAKFSVEALIGITLDDNDVVLVSINETFSNNVDSETSSSASKRQLEVQSFDNQKPKQQISIKDETFDEQGDFNNEEIDSNFHRNQNVEDESNFLNSDSNNQNDNNPEDENSNQYDNSNMAENIMYIKSESEETADAYNWMMNSTNDFNTPPSYTSRPGPYSLPMRRQRGRGRAPSRGQQRGRPHYNQNNYIPSQQSMTSFHTTTNPGSSSSQTRPFSQDDKEEFHPIIHNSPRQPKLKARGKNAAISGITTSSGLVEMGKNVFACNFCSMTFTLATSLRDHVHGIHLNTKMYHCEMCGEAFKWRSILSKHRRVYCPFTATA